ncbi:MAG: flagellar basal body rod protein FlgB [Proteobacteria bacterium]|nr:flagellar basal body rod protein FlgB [Pseudomonadota bacterium]NBY20562.1 flagellar basal body rod protein FlgB [bacterium]
MPLFDKTIDTITKSLDLHLQRHSIIADNIANAETPFFKARRVDFEAELQRAVDESEVIPGVNDIESVEGRISQEPFSEVGQDLNTVDMDREMAAMNKNDVKYSANTQALSRKFLLLKYAIGEGEK